jgi:hypothetical protein
MPNRFITTIACLLAIASQARAQPDDLEWVDWEDVDDGEIVYKTERVARGTIRIDLVIAIDADWQSVWDILTACEISPEFVPHVVECSQIDTISDGSAELFLQTVKPAFFLPRFDHVFRLDYFPPERMNVSHVSGPIDRMEGSWRFIERPGKSMALAHSMTLKPGFPVPPLFVRNTLTRDLPKVLREIATRAEAAYAAATR